MLLDKHVLFFRGVIYVFLWRLVSWTMCNQPCWDMLRHVSYKMRVRKNGALTLHVAYFRKVANMLTSVYMKKRLLIPLRSLRAMASGSLSWSVASLKKRRMPQDRGPWGRPVHFQLQVNNYTSSTAQGGGGSFKNRKPIGEVGCCELGMAERSHWRTERCLRSPLFLSLSLAIYLPTHLFSMYLSICWSSYLSLSFSLSSHYLSTYLPIYLSIYLSLSFICLSV